MYDKKTVIIAGSDAGLGLECPRNTVIGSSDYQAVLACRDLTKAEQAKGELDKEVDCNIQAMEL